MDLVIDQYLSTVKLMHEEFVSPQKIMPRLLFAKMENQKK